MAALSFQARQAAQTARVPVTAKECVNDVVTAMHAAGVHPAEHITAQLLRSGEKIVRFRCEGDKSGRKNGWARFSSNPIPYAAFGNWRLGLSEMWTAKGGIAGLSLAEREALDREIELNKARKQKKTEAAATRAQFDLSAAKAASPDHPYLARKNIGAEKLYQSGNQLIVPIFDIDGKLASLQFISSDGSKKFLPGGKIGGNFWMCGQPGAEISIGEGVATMAAVRRATGFAVIAAMNAGNLLPVAKLIRQRRPKIRIVMCADDDAIGIAEAEKAAKAVGGTVVRPFQSEARA